MKIIHNELVKLMQEFLPCPVIFEILRLHQCDVATLANKESFGTMTLKFIHLFIDSNPPILTSYDDSNNTFAQTSGLFSIISSSRNYFCCQIGTYCWSTDRVRGPTLSGMVLWDNPITNDFSPTVDGQLT